MGKFKIQLSSEPEKIIAVASVSTALAILFSGKRKKKSKRKNFFQRVERNYKVIDDVFSATIARELQTKIKDEEELKTKLKDLNIETAEFIDL